jgi:hypothetical protein
MPGILIHILLESLFSLSRNPYSHAPEYAVIHQTVTGLHRAVYGLVVQEWKMCSPIHPW